METMRTDNPGTTSAHAENTNLVAIVGGAIGNYLRARGEYNKPPCDHKHSRELPPRTRRIQILHSLIVRPGGTTSAHAENTTGKSNAVRRIWNYLRARGEYKLNSLRTWSNTELPPRTRRIRLPRNETSRLIGTTSAHAENTHAGQKP